MSLSALCIHRPIATSLLTLGLVLLGLVAFNYLPVASLPQVEFPTISVQASLPGASPETVAATVSTPLERRLGRIAGVAEMTSSSSLGYTKITLQFELERDINGAARDVQAAINAARAELPMLPSNPRYKKVNPAASPVMILAMTSDTASKGEMYDIASTRVAQCLLQVEGIGDVDVGGSSLPAVRVVLNPNTLNQYGISLSQISDVLRAAHLYQPKGSVEYAEKHWQINAKNTMHKAEDFRPLIVAWRNGAAVRLSDVAEVIDSVEDVRDAGFANGKPSVLLIIRTQPDANIISTVEKVRALLPQLQAAIPASIALKVTMDRTPSIRASLREVEGALLISIVLVLLVVLLFLRSVRLALIPATAVLVALIGTFCVMYLLDFSLNNISLMALTVAVCFVVDDAVVVVENISRHIEKGMLPLQATLKGVQEVSLTVVAISLSLVAVFIPVLLMGGVVGRIFREFAITLSAAVLISLLISLTLTPMMCALLLKKKPEENRFFKLTEKLFNRVLDAYARSLSWALHRPRFIVCVLLATIGLNAYLYLTIPKGFFPQQDTGRLQGGVQADQSLSFQAMEKKLNTFMELVRADPAVSTVVGFTQGGGFGMMYVSLKPLQERDASSAEVIRRLQKKAAQEPGAQLFLRASQDIRIGGRSGNAEYQYTLQGDDIAQLRTWIKALERALKATTRLEDVSSNLEDKGMQTMLTLDREVAARLGITAKVFDATLANAFSQRQVSNIFTPFNQYHLVMELAPAYLQSPQSLSEMYVHTQDGKAIPMLAISNDTLGATELAVNHQDGFAAMTLSFNPPTGMSLSEAVKEISLTTARMGMPTSIQGSFQGTAKAFQSSLSSQPWLIIAALVAVYIVLGILYESYMHPLTILSTLPSAGVGALLALMMANTEFSIMALIGVILLIGIVQKNAILMIDFALNAERTEGKGSREAIYQACLLRFRPIIMTTMAALLGALPLAIGFGEGSELRQPLGIAVVGGLLLSQLLTLYTVPVIYLYLDRFRLSSGLFYTKLSASKK